MIKLIVKNMSCGHCQLKVKAELESNHYNVIKIDMDENSVLVDADRSASTKLIKILDRINYVVDEQYPIMDIMEYTIWDDKLDDESNYGLFTSYLDDNEVEIVGFNDEEFGVVILCTKSQLKTITQYIAELY